jgi:hypothetical protein
MARHPVFTFLALALSLGACVAPRTSAELETRVEVLAGVPVTVTLGDCGITRQGGTPLFHAEIRNGSRVAACNLQWQVEFFDGDGLRVAASDTRWTNVTLGIGESVQVQTLASNPLAVDFKLKIKPR